LVWPGFDGLLVLVILFARHETQRGGETITSHHLTTLVNRENAIILDAKGPVNGLLRFSDEYVRHKVLDLIGDLSLAGRRIEGHVVAERAGHAMHTALVSRLLKDRSAWELAHVPVETALAEETISESLSGNSFSSPALVGV